MKNLKYPLFFTIFLLSAMSLKAQTLRYRWDELTASDWPMALKMSDSTCILPLGILEKHGPHAPIGTDLINVREWSARAAAKEYAVVFPDYFYGQINEGKHQPGAFSLPPRVVWDLLEATCDEITRNGFRKIVIINGHGGNPDLIHYFMQTRLEKRRNYAIYFFDPADDAAYNKKIAELSGAPATGDHAGALETSEIVYLRPELLKLDSAHNESGQKQNRLYIPNVYTPIWWFADYPNHYAGDGAKATKNLGEFETEYTIDTFIQALKAIKADTVTRKLQNEFFDRINHLER